MKVPIVIMEPFCRVRDRPLTNADKDTLIFGNSLIITKFVKTSPTHAGSGIQHYTWLEADRDIKDYSLTLASNNKTDYRTPHPCLVLPK